MTYLSVEAISVFLTLLSAATAHTHLFRPDSALLNRSWLFNLGMPAKARLLCLLKPGTPPCVSVMGQVKPPDGKEVFTSSINSGQAHFTTS